MKRDGFKPGQTVYLLRINGRNPNQQENIVEAKVLSVGRKYLNVMYQGEVKFDMTKDFKQVTIYTPEFRLYQTKEEILKELDRTKKRAGIRLACEWPNDALDRMTGEDLDTVYQILEKYKAGCR